jgi:A/G-specific adenine glycosylase
MKNVWFMQHQILAWFQKNGRVLPWRVRDARQLHGDITRDAAMLSYMDSTKGRDPYVILVSELMLQQTQVDRVLPKYLDFMQRWPTITALSKATLTEVLIAWKGLGYNRRAKHLLETAIIIEHEYKGVFPQDEVLLVKLPGIGTYTARAILAFAYNKPVAVTDTNIKRIFARFVYGCEFSDLKISMQEFEKNAESAIPESMADPWYQALMDFGALICVSQPKCEICPLQKQCAAYKKAVQLGQTSYKSVLQLTKVSSGKKKIPFKETDRYLRGRIIDTLREQPYHMEDLQRMSREKWGLTTSSRDLKRWGSLIEDLKTEGLIQITGSTVSLS